MLGRVVSEFVELFHREVASPLGDFDISFKMFYENDWRSELEMNVDFLTGVGCCRWNLAIRTVRQNISRYDRVRFPLAIETSLSVGLG
jgi:hypothetical protein